MLGTSIDSTIILQEPIRLFYALPYLCGLWLLSIFVNMIYYEIKYYNGAGEDYLRYGKYGMLKNYYTRLILNIPMEIEVRACCLTKYWYEI